jgi:hypothetical protein
MALNESARAANGRPADAADPLQFVAAVRIRAAGCRPVIRTVGEALQMIENELPAELRRLRRWTFARALLEEANRTRRKNDVSAAARQLKQALSNEGWLADEKHVKPSS